MQRDRRLAIPVFIFCFLLLDGAFATLPTAAAHGSRARRVGSQSKHDSYDGHAATKAGHNARRAFHTAKLGIMLEGDTADSRLKLRRRHTRQWDVSTQSRNGDRWLHEESQENNMDQSVGTEETIQMRSVAVGDDGVVVDKTFTRPRRRDSQLGPVMSDSRVGSTEDVLDYEEQPSTCQKDFDSLQFEWNKAFRQIVASKVFGPSMVDAAAEALKALKDPKNVKYRKYHLHTTDPFSNIILGTAVLGMALNLYALVRAFAFLVDFDGPKNDFQEFIFVGCSLLVMILLVTVFYVRRYKLEKQNVMATLTHLDKLDFRPVTRTALRLKYVAYAVALTSLVAAMAVIILKDSNHLDFKTSKMIMTQIAAMTGFVTFIFRLVVQLWGQSKKSSDLEGFVPTLSTLGEDTVLVAVKAVLDERCRENVLDKYEVEACNFERFDLNAKILELRSLVATAYKCELDLLVADVSDGVTVLYNVGNLLGMLTLIIHFDDYHQ